MQKVIYFYFFLIFIKGGIRTLFLFHNFNLEIHNINHSLDNYVITNFGLRDSNESYNATLGPFHKWGGRSKYECIKIQNQTCVKSELKILNDPEYIYKFSGKYLTGNKYKKYKDLFKEGFIIKQNENCKYGLKNCGKIDTLGQILCLPEEIQCPIQDFMVNENYYVKEYENIEYKYDKVDDIISYSNKRTDLSIIGNISLNSGVPCLNMNEQSWIRLDKTETDETTYCQIEFNGTNIDKRYQFAGKISSINIYESNLPKDAFNSMYNNIIGHSLYIYTRPFIGINLDCYNESNFDFFFRSVGENSDVIIRYSLIYFIITIFYILFILVGFFHDCYKYGECCCKQDIEEDCFHLILFFLSMYNLFSFMYHFTGIRLFNKLNCLNCSDKFTNSLLQEYVLIYNFTLVLTFCEFILAIHPIYYDRKEFCKNLKECCTSFYTLIYKYICKSIYKCICTYICIKKEVNHKDDKTKDLPIIEITEVKNKESSIN